MDTLDRTNHLDQALLAAPHDQTNRHFIAAWLGWRRPGQLLPKRSALKLDDIKQLLGRVVLFELVSADEIRVKVAGSQLRDHINFEATGRSFAELTPPAQWPLRRFRLNEMAARPCGTPARARSAGQAAAADQQCGCPRRHLRAAGQRPAAARLPCRRIPLPRPRRRHSHPDGALNAGTGRVTPLQEEVRPGRDQDLGKTPMVESP
jgi:PAS domain